LLEHACARGGVPVYFDRGTRRPDPAGRAFIALLSCVVEGLSAKRFDEYLSLGQVPSLSHDPSSVAPLVPGDEAARALLSAAEGQSEWVESPDTEHDGVAPPDSDEDAIVSGTLRAPWKWEELIVESAVVGGRSREDGKARWRRRLDGLAADYHYRIEELMRE